jgi:hypothetical protein
MNRRGFVRTHSLERLENAKDQQVLPGWADPTPGPALYTGQRLSRFRLTGRHVVPLGMAGRPGRPCEWVQCLERAHGASAARSPAGRRLPETQVGEQSDQPRQDPDWSAGRSIGRWTWCRSTAHLAAATGEWNELEDMADRPVEEPEGHRRMLAAPDAPGVKVQFIAHGWHSRHREVRQDNDEQESK